MAEVTGQKETRDLRSRESDHQTNNATTGILSTTVGVVCFLLAFTFLRGTEQLLVVSLGGLLATGGIQ